MRDRLWMRGLVFVIIGLFIGTSFFPGVTGQIEKIEQSTESVTLQSIDIDEHNYVKTFSTNDNALKCVFDEPELDQYQNETETDATVPFGVFPPDDEIKLAQSFKPSYPILSKIEILLKKTVNPHPIKLSVIESLNSSESLITIEVNNPGISDYPIWTTVDFPDINVTPQNTYYIICSTTASAVLFIYNWHFGGNNYERGVSYNYINGTWSLTDLQEYDFCFKTYGTQKDQKPVANFYWTPEIPKIGEIITFNGSASYDPDGEIILYKWDWDNDGTFDESYPTPFAAHSWTESDSYPVTLQVLDNTSLSSNITKNVNIYDIIVPVDYPTIQDAIDNSQVDYSIYVQPGGTYKENIHIDIEQVQLHGGNSINTTIDGQRKGSVITISEMSYDIEISGFTIKNSGTGYDGINMQSFYSNIHDNNIIDNGVGVNIQQSSGNEITANYFQNNGDAISIHNGSFALFISNNTIEQNQQNGIYIDNLSDSHLIQHNTILGNKYGIKIDGASKGTVVCENIISNNNIGVDCVFFSDGNRFFYNTLKKNIANAYDDSMDRWDNNAIGNYWDDYTGVDTNGDGIGDTPYLIPGGDNKDRYPLMYPWGPPTTPISPTGPIDGKQGKNYEYLTMSTDPDGDPIKYGWDWNGDNSVDEWTPYYPSGENGSITHKFTKGEHQVQVIAKDSHNQSSAWSNPINVSITRSVIYDTLFVAKNVKYPSLLSLIISRFKIWGDRVAAYGCGKPYMVEKKQPLVSSADSRTIYVPDDYSTIQEAIDNSHDSDIIIVSPGIYREHLVVNKQLTIKGEEGKRNQTIIDGDNVTGHIIYITSNKVTIQNFTIRNCPPENSGIEMVGTDNNTILNNTILNCGNGLYMLDARRIIIKGNDLFSNKAYAIFIQDCIDCILFNNKIKYNPLGIESIQTNYTTKTSNRLEKNLIYKNTQNGILLNHVDTMNISNTIISAHSGKWKGLDIENSANIQCYKNSYTQNGKDVYLYYSSYNTFTHNNFGTPSILDLDYAPPILFSSDKAVNTFKSNNNLFHHNNFQAKINVLDVFTNIYYMGSEGNYWNDYTGKDADHNGIGDTPYKILPGKNIDRYPLMKPLV